MFPFATSPAVWAALALLQGVGTAGAATMANAYILEARPEDEWEERIGWLQTFYGAGQGVHSPSTLLLGSWLLALNGALQRGLCAGWRH